MDEKINPGDLYEDCKYHPMLCLVADYEGDSLEGVSLITGQVGNCSINHCGVRKLTVKEAFRLKCCGPDDMDMRRTLAKDYYIWWDKNSAALYKALEPFLP